MKNLLLLLLLPFFLTSCNGQVKSNLPIDSTNVLKIRPVGSPKIIRAQGTDENQNIGCGLQDKEGNLWFGTTGEGIYRYDGISFIHFTTKDGLAGNDVNSMLEDKTGLIWFGTKEGLCRYDPATAKFTNIPIAVGGGPSVKQSVWSMLQDRSGTLWFGTFDSGIYRYDGKSFTHFLDNDGIINSNNLHPKWVESILEDRAGNIWFGGRSWSEEGACLFDGRSVTNFKPDNERWLRPLLQDRSGNIWFGSRNHCLYLYDGKTFTSVAKKEISEWVFSMKEDNAGNLWFSSGKNGGVTCYDGTSFKYFTTKEGLSNNSVWSIVKDRTGNLWFGTKNIGLCRYDGKTFTRFSE